MGTKTAAQLTLDFNKLVDGVRRQYLDPSNPYTSRQLRDDLKQIATTSWDAMMMVTNNSTAQVALNTLVSALGP